MWSGSAFEQWRADPDAKSYSLPEGWIWVPDEPADPAADRALLERLIEATRHRPVRAEVIAGPAHDPVPATLKRILIERADPSGGQLFYRVDCERPGADVYCLPLRRLVSLSPGVW